MGSTHQPQIWKSQCQWDSCMTTQWEALEWMNSLNFGTGSQHGGQLVQTPSHTGCGASVSGCDNTCMASMACTCTCGRITNGQGLVACKFFCCKLSCKTSTGNHKGHHTEKICEDSNDLCAALGSSTVKLEDAHQSGLRSRMRSLQVHRGSS